MVFSASVIRRGWLRAGVILAVAMLACARGTAAEKPLVSPQREQHFRQKIQPFIITYCADCHVGPEAEAGIQLTTYRSAEDVGRNRKTWRSVADKLRAHEMPPRDARQPPRDEAAAVVAWLDATIAEAVQNTPRDPGRVTMRRLNRAEYKNTIRDLIGIDFEAADDFPADDVGYGFDNIGDVLALPPLLLEKYLAAAEKIAEQAIVVDTAKTAPKKRYEAESMAARNASGGSPTARFFSSTGEVFAQHSFPDDAEYLVRIRAWGEQAGDEPVRVSLKINDKVKHVFDVPAEEDEPGVYEHRLALSGGPQKFALEFSNDFYNPDEPDRSRRDRNLALDWVEIVGPLGKSADLPATHRRIFIADPKQHGTAEAARRILRAFAGRAYRRPITDDELDRLLRLFEQVVRDGQPFERGIQLVVTATLVSPHFLFRVEIDREPNNGNVERQINEFELASRLSYFLWSSMPDDDLLALAAIGELRDQLEPQVRRMLRDRKAQALVDNFAGQWLQTRRLESMTPDAKLFPTWTDKLKAALRKEMSLFFATVLVEDRSVLELIDANYTFLNERLAKFYGIGEVTGEHFRRVELPPGSPRGGVLTMASVLAISSNPTRTSPVKRGKWLMENILGTPPPPPPPGVPELNEKKEAADSASLRERLTLHRADPACAACHDKMDPLGFGLENFDAIGAWRDRDGKHAIDASGTLPDGRSFRGPKELKQIVLAQRDLFSRSLSERMLTYALGRGLEEYDDPVIDDVAAKVRRGEYKFSALVLAVVRSDPFQKRRGAK